MGLKDIVRVGSGEARPRLQVGRHGCRKRPERPGPEIVLAEVEPEDLIKFGLIPELVGRLPVIASWRELS